MHSLKTRSVQVYHEGRLAEIDIPIGSLSCDLISLLLDCFILSLASEDDQYQMFDPSSRLPCQVFNGRYSNELPIADISVVSKIILSNTVSIFLTDLRARRDLTVEVIELSLSKLTEIVPLYVKEEVKMLSTPELTSLLFLLYHSGPTPLVSPELHKLGREKLG
jgi:hypothetical protein